MNAEKYIALPGRAVLSLAGEEARSFLQGLVTNDVEQVSETRAIYAALLTPQGKFLHDFFIVERGGKLLLDCDSARVGDLEKRLKMYRLRAKVDIADETADWSVYALLPGGGEAGAAEDWMGGVAFADPRHAGLGLRAIAPANADPGESGLTPGELADYDAVRVALGIPDGARDLVPEKSMPLENGFDELNGVSFAKGCFVGQEVTTRMKHRNLVKRRLFPVAIDGAAEAGMTVKSGEADAGELRAVMDGHGLALLRLDMAERDDLVAGDAAIRPARPDWVKF